ncbi:SpoIIE family protein phosphatase [Streptomyces sp. ST2-7A]|uniref:SpoIIE family protein phosphatase n=1 Tax=Streptomyces sp. ST2-7A TaxID=2907214 RepID=UPI001F380A27|nr:SpoIIE family protein phosphatase [Streptomyces sp. ST2-7A]MCE7083061.1 SpoIIE family protein phosphatase [Streptomyces sp. ST2-7A]
MRSVGRAGRFAFAPDTGRLHMDGAALAVFDVTPEEWKGDAATLLSRLLPGEAGRLEALITRVVSRGRSGYGAYVRLRGRDGAVRWVHTRGGIRRDAAGNVRWIIGVVRDAGTVLLRDPAPTDPGATGRADPGSPAERADTTEGNADDADGTADPDAAAVAVTEETVAALARARSVRDVLDLLRVRGGMDRLGVIGLTLGLVEAGRIHVVAEGRGAGPVPELLYTRVDEAFPMSEAVRTLSPLFVIGREEFAARYPRLWPYIASMPMTAAAYLPLIARGRVIGVIGLLYREKRRFTARERNFLVMLAGGIAQSLQSAMLIEQDHELAADLQKTMLPRVMPAVRGLRIAVRYRPARVGRDVGGDWYDAIPLPGGRLAAVVGDVQGHDTHAAAVMGQLRIVLRAYATEGHEPGAVVQRASAFLRDLDTDRFATCVYAEVDPTTGWLRMVRAGHVQPLLRRADGTWRPLPVAGSLPLGLSTDLIRPEHPVTTLELGPGESLLMYTDGLVERPGVDPEEGAEILLRAIGAPPRDEGAAGDESVPPVGSPLPAGSPRPGVVDPADPVDVEGLADRLCESGGNPIDDIALLVLHRERDVASVPARTACLRVPAGDPDALSRSRRSAREVALAAGAGTECADAVETVTGELVANALLHTSGAALLSVRVIGSGTTGRRLRIEVEDRSSAPPRRRAAGEGAISGRGLLLVDLLADDWGTDSRGDGKVVWCEFGCLPHHGAAEAA